MLKMPALTVSLWTELWIERHSKSPSEQKRWENVLQSCHPFDIQLYRALESAAQIALKEVALVFGGFSCLCRKERKEGEESWRHSEKHRAKQSRTMGETSNTNCRSQWPHHKHLLLHPESRQVLAQVSKLCFSDWFFWLDDSKARHYYRPEGTWNIQNVSVRKTSLKSLTPSRSSYLQYALSAAKKKKKNTKVYKFKKRNTTLPEFLLFFSSSLLLPEKACRYKSVHVEPRHRQARVYRHVGSRPF